MGRIDGLAAQPITSAAVIRAAINARHQRALEGLKVLERAGVVRRISDTSWDQQFAADDLFALLERYEDMITSGGGTSARRATQRQSGQRDGDS